MSDFKEETPTEGSGDKKRGRVVQVRLIAVRNDDDPRALRAVEEALASAVESSDESASSEIGGVAPDAVRDYELEQVIRVDLRDRLDAERPALIERRELGGDSVDLPAIQKRAEQVVKERASLRKLFKDLQQFEADIPSNTPWWRYAVKVVIKTAEKVLVGGGADESRE